MLCYITDGVVNRRGDADFLSTELMIWLSFAIFCTLLELRLMYSMSALFRWCERSESTKPPPKYSKCVRGSNKKRSIEYLPTYAEAIKAIDKQKKAERHKSSYMPHLSAMKDAPIFTLQHTEDIRHLSFPTRVSFLL
ncbi:hypothetical protein AB6A40_010844 [Gnathostoma spinigerum]|uniref:Uncharacterized protein n=1 Tax=Gnathostoma spinigerum TaxID=75299 RepID=A0ABD6F403_9BILA